MSESKFTSTLRSFCTELRSTYPELTEATTRALTTVTPSFYWRSWQANLEILATRDSNALFSERRGILVAPLALTPALWGEVSEATHAAIWRYLRALLLETLTENGFDDSTVTFERAQFITIILTEERLKNATATMDISAGISAINEATSDILGGGMGGFVEKLRGLLPKLASIDASGGWGDSDIPPLPDIPERLRNGKLARLAQDIAKQFNPEDFGIDAAMFAAAGDNIEAILLRLVDLYKKDPTKLMAGSKRMVERIQRQIMGGSLKHEELLAEAREFVEIFKDHPLFKEAIEKFQELMGEGGVAEMMGGLGGGTTAAPSERLRTVQERLRKKLASRSTKK